MTQQAEVTETNQEPTQASGEVENAQDEVSLDSLLSEYDEPKEEPKAAPQPEVPQISPDVQNFMNRQIKKENDQAINEAAKIMKESVGDTNLTEKWFKGQLHLAGAEDPRIIDAFNNRDNAPKQWEAIVKGIATDLAKELAPTDQSATESWNAVASAVHSASTSAPKTEPGFSEKDLKNMSDAEFQAFKKQHGFSR